MNTISNERLEAIAKNALSEERRMMAAELLVLRKERDKEESAVCPKCGNTGLADSGGVQPWGEPILIECDCTAPPAPDIADDSLPYDPQIAEYEQMMEAEQAQADTTAQQFELLAGKAVVPEGWKLVPIEPTVEMQIAFAEAWFSKVRCVDDCELEDAYIAMLAAAPDFREISNSSTKHFRENAESSTNGWIPCSERLPEEGGRYWCYVEEINSLGKSHYQWNCSWNGEDWGGEGFYGRVTHWQPLPEPPCK